MSPFSDSNRGAPEYRPYWQLLLLGAVLLLGAYAGAQMDGEGRQLPSLSFFIFAGLVVLSAIGFRALRFAPMFDALLSDSAAEQRLYSARERISLLPALFC